MSEHILKCPKCSTYTMEPLCPKCNEKTFSPKPPKYSPEDAYGDYRRKAKRKGLEDKGLV